MKVFFPVCISLSLLLSGCAYHMTIEQGINLTPTQIGQVQVGMSQDQVTYILGTPNLVDPYHPDTWYYVYSNKENYEPRTQNTVVVHFDANDKVSSIEEVNNGIAAYS